MRMPGVRLPGAWWQTARRAVRGGARGVVRRFSQVLGVVTPLGRAVSLVALVSFVVQQKLGWLEFGVVALVGALLVTLAILLVLLPQAATGRLRLDPVRVTAGEPATVEVGLRAGLVPLLNPAVRLTIAGVSSSVRLPVVPSRAERSEVLEIPGLPRGVHVVGPLLHVRSDPLGLAQRRTRRAGRQELLVRPRVAALRALDPGLISDLDGVPSESPTASDLAFHTLREYVAGDDLRHVHWRSSAKASQLLVRQYVETRRNEAVVLLDGAASSYADTAEFELAVSAAASLAVRALRDDFEVTLVCGEVIATSRVADVVLDATCRIVTGDVALQGTARRAAAAGGASSLVGVVSGSRSAPGGMRLAAGEFPSDATRLLVRVERGAPSAVLAVPGFRSFALWRLDDLVALVAVVAGSGAAA
jgi:Protein of unknown function DUF58